MLDVNNRHRTRTRVVKAEDCEVVGVLVSRQHRGERRGKGRFGESEKVKTWFRSRGDWTLEDDQN